MMKTFGRQLPGRFVPAFCAALLIASSARGQTTRYVGGTNTPNYATITAAITASGYGDTIRIETNLVTEAGIAVNKPFLTFIGLGRTSTIVQAHTNYDSAANRIFSVSSAATNATFRDMTIRHGKLADGGGGIQGYNASIVVSNCVITRNRATGTANGGGVQVYSSAAPADNLAIYGSTISDNTSAGAGGGVHTGNAGTCDLFDSTISGNTSGSYGGGIAVYYAATGQVVNCTIASNQSSFVYDNYHGGGGFDAYFSGGVTIRNSTIVSNSIPAGQGGGIYQYGAMLLESTIIAGNTAGYATLPGPDFRNRSGALTERCNFIRNNADAGMTAGSPNANRSYIGTSAAPLDPKALPLADNGGRAKTCALQADSLAINHGTNTLALAFDQRGAPFQRTKGAQPDIGAYEYGAGWITLTYSALGFAEKLPASNGSIDNSGPLLLTLDWDTFTGTDGSEITNNVVVSNLPAGLSVSMIRTNAGTNAIVKLLGAAVAHAPSDSIANLGFAFQHAAFSEGDATRVINATRADLTVTFNDPPTTAAGLAYSGTSFVEDAVWNDGRIDNNTPVSITLSNDTFTGAADDNLVTAGKVFVANLPNSLTAMVTRVNSTNVSVTLAGLAAAHMAANAVTNLTLAFLDGAFSGANAAAVIGSSNASLQITFLDPATNVQLLYGAAGFGEAAASNDGQIDNATPLTITLTNDVFTGANGDDFVAGGKVLVSNLPVALTAVVTRVDLRHLAVTLTGAAAAHNAVNNVGNLTFAFQDSAFHNTAAAAVTNSTRADLAISFANPTVTWSGGFVEKLPDNDGSINASTLVTATLKGDTFAGAIGAMAGTFSTANVPSGLTLVVTKTSATNAVLTFTGNAAAHVAADSVNNLTVTFGDSAFATCAAAAVTNSGKTDLAVLFYNPASTWYVSASGTNGPPGDGSLAHPWATIAYAVGQATNWDVIRVLSGVLTENGIVVGKPLVIQGDGKGSTIVQGAATRGTAANGIFYVTADALIRDMTLRYGNRNSGSAVSQIGAGTVRLEDCLIVSNNCVGLTAHYDGGAVYGTGGGLIQLTRCVVTDTDSAGTGGIVGFDSSLIVSNCVVSRNLGRGVAPGGIDIGGYATPTLRVYGSTISDNTGSIAGGIASSAKSVYLYNSTVSGNTCSNYGGGLYVYAAPVLLLANSTIYGNTAYATNAAMGGGGVHAYASTTIRNCTIVSNACPNGIGGGINQYYATLDIESSILAGNTAATGPDHYRTSSQPLSERFNLIGTTNGSVFVAGWPNANTSYVGTAASPADPMLLPLADNKGLTRTCALQAGSPAIDNGSNPLGLLYDQRGPGYVRTSRARPDIGAFEFGAGASKGTAVFFR
jgi:hypothetical protein